MYKGSAQLREHATIVGFNMGENRAIISEDKITNTADNVVEFEDMTDEQKRIVAAGETSVCVVPQGLSKEELCAWLLSKFP